MPEHVTTPEGQPRTGSPGARRLLAAAREITAQKGWSACTLDAVTKAAGLDKTAIRYYFGDRDGLVHAFVASVLAQVAADAARSLAELETAEDRIAARMDQHREWLSSRQATLLIELIPVTMRDERLRPLLAESLLRQREAESLALAPHASGDARRLADILATLVSAGMLGLSFRTRIVVEPDIEAVLGLWQRVIRCWLTSCDTEDASGNPARSKPSAAVTTAPRPEGIELQLPPVPDPLQGLPASAVRLVRGTQELARQIGWSALTVSAVTSRAGLQKPAVSYYFGDKAGLITATVESVFHDENADEVRHLARLSGTENVLDVHLAHLRSDAASDWSVPYMELITFLMRERSGREKLAEWITLYGRINAYALSLECGRLIDPSDPLVLLTGDVDDGLAVRCASGPDDEVTEAYSLLARVLRRELLDA